MTVERISTLEGFEAERERWEQLEKLDPNATLFTTLEVAARVSADRALPLDASSSLRDGTEAIAYLPVARNASPLDRELYLAGTRTPTTPG